VEEDVAPDQIDVGTFGADLVILTAGDITDAVEQLGSCPGSHAAGTKFPLVPTLSPAGRGLGEGSSAPRRHT